MRGRVQSVPELAPAVVVTFHPSAVLRGGDRRGQLREQALHDLELARDALPG